MSASESDDGAGPVRAVVLDYLARGHADDDRPQYERSPVAYAVGEDAFTLFELELGSDADVAIDDRIVVNPPAERTPGVDSVTVVEYEDLTGGAQSELEYVVAEIVERDEERFVDFYNDAQPITLRLHQLNLLPGIGKKLRDNVLDERKRGPFESFEELEERVPSLHDPAQVIVDRILEEIRDEDLKYRAFVGGAE